MYEYAATSQEGRVAASFLGSRISKESIWMATPLKKSTTNHLPTAKEMLKELPTSKETLQKLIAEQTNLPQELQNLRSSIPLNPLLQQTPDPSLDIPGLESSISEEGSSEEPPLRYEDLLPDVKPSKPNKLTLQLSFLYEKLGELIGKFNPIDGVLISSGAIDRASELYAIGQSNPAFMNFLKTLVSGNAYIAAILGHGMVALAILANHGLVPTSQVTDLFTKSLSDAIASNIPSSEN